MKAICRTFVAVVTLVSCVAQSPTEPTPLEMFRERIKGTTWWSEGPVGSHLTLYFAPDGRLIKYFDDRISSRGRWQVPSLRRLIIDWDRRIDSNARIGERETLAIEPDLKTLIRASDIKFHLRE